MANNGGTRGFREASRQLANMSKAMARGIGKRALQAPADVLRDGMISRVSVDSGATRDSIATQKARAKKGRPQVEVVSADIASIQLEFGNSSMAAQPFARPALDGERSQMMAAFEPALSSEIDKAVIRQAKKAARAAAKER